MRRRVRIWDSRYIVLGLFAILVYAASVFLLKRQRPLEISSSVQSKPAAKMLRAGPTAAPLVISAGKPFLLYGTAWKKEDTALLVEQAITSGFRFIDTAAQPKHYNELGVGEGCTAAVLKLGLSRSDIFIQTKYTPIRGQDPNRVPYDASASLDVQVKQSLKVSLENLQTTYLDSLVLHSPLQTFEETLLVWRKMESFVDGGEVLRLGISNCYDSDLFQRLYQEARIKPSVLQNRFYAESNFDTALRQFCKAHNIWYQSFWTLTANRAALQLPKVKSLAESKNLTPQTLMYAFIMSWGYGTPLCGTKSDRHMKEDVELVMRMQRGEKVFESDADLRDFAQLLGMPDM